MQVASISECINIHLDVRSEFFDHELSIFKEQAVGLGDHLDFGDGSGAGSPSGLVAPLRKTCHDLEDLAGGVVKLVE